VPKSKVPKSKVPKFDVKKKKRSSPLAR
jgi:hypothetical protein